MTSYFGFSFGYGSICYMLQVKISPILHGAVLDEKIDMSETKVFILKDIWEVGVTVSKSFTKNEQNQPVLGQLSRLGFDHQSLC